MLNTKYYKDLNHNYLIIKENLKEEEKNYQHKMITANRMKYLLECKIRYVDEECHFYYEISSKQSIYSLFSNKMIGYEQLHRFFMNVQEALCELENYMLDSRRLILQPEYIFADPEEKEFYFLYFPHYNEEAAAQMSLAQFLVDHVDHEQEKAVIVAYKVYEMMQDQQFILSEVLDLFSEEEPVSESEPIRIAAPQSEWNENIIENDNTWKPEDKIESKCGEVEEERSNAGHLLAVGILMSICIVASVGIFCIRYFCQLSVEESIFSMVGIIILTVVSAFLLLYLIFNVCARGRKRRKKEETPDFATVEADLYIAPEAPAKTDYYPCSTDYKRTKIQDTREVCEQEYGNTVFLEASMLQSENKLYGTNKGNKYHIDLNHLPCTIGKMAGSVDVVIKDSTISRIHARFTRQEEGICVTDMNSTNGSFKNGLRLEPNETVLIEPGDELRFGRMTFCYR